MTRRIRCFFLEPTGYMSVKLRRYCLEQSTCTGGYHDASVFIEDEPVERDAQGGITNTLKPIPAQDDPRWPNACACGYQFQEQDKWQRFSERTYRRTDTGEEMTIRDAPAGAMWYAEWLDHMCVSQDDKHPLMVRTPGGDWIIDSQSSNCTMPDDRGQQRHHCWIRHGTPPDVTVDKAGLTCGAGAGSILCGTYHGFLRGGYLED